MLAIPSVLAACPTPNELADCSVGDWKRRTCEAVTGPNGGAGACKFRGNKNLNNYGECVNKASFVDAPQKPVLADCSLGNYRKKTCEAITGPTGAAGACKFKNNKHKENYRKCINNNNFVDDEPCSETTTTTTTTTVARCFQGPVVKQRGRKKFRIAFGDDVPLEQCLTECKALVNCVGISFQVGDKVSFTVLVLYPVCGQLILCVSVATTILKHGISLGEFH
jgi:hypothetical protein